MLGVEVNYWAVLICGILSIVLGSIWYGPLFGKAWMKYMGFTKKEIDKAKKEGMSKTYFVALVSALITSFVLAYLVGYFSVDSFLGGMKVGLLAWVGFFVTTQLGVVLWEGKPFNYYLISVGYYLVFLLVSGGILAIWS